MADTPSRSSERLPWPLLGAAVVSFVALYLTSGRAIGLIVLAALLVGSALVGWRLPRDRVLGWIVRLVPMIAIVLVVGVPEEDVVMWYIKPAYTNLVGYLLATEVVLQAWTRRPATPAPDPRADALRDPVRARESSGLILLLTAFIMTTAANTYHRDDLAVLTPIYALFVILCLRSFTRMSQGGEDLRRRRPLLALSGMRIAAGALALLLGFGTVYAVTHYENKITSWAVDLLRQRKNKSAEIGLSGTPRLQGVFNPDASTTRVLLIDGPVAERHLRALAFDTYEGREWLPTMSSRQWRPLDVSRLSGGSHERHLRFTRLAETLDVIPLPPQTVSLQAPVPAEIDGLGVVREGEIALHYETMVTNSPVVVETIFREPPTAEMRQRLLAVPAQVDAKVSELARQVAGEGSPGERVVRLANHLRTNHAYSLRYEPQGEPLSDFILNQRAAHCQYFASALVVMCRAAGVPARLVTGYYAHETYGEEQMVVRDRDAHAWAEVWDERAGWVTADATPAGGRPDGLFEEPSAWEKFWERVGDVPRIIKEWWSGISRGALIVFAALFLAIVGLVRLWQWWRQRGPRAAPERGYDAVTAELAAAARRFERWLLQRGVPCPSNRTWREHLAMTPGIDVPAARAFIEAYDGARFRGRGDGVDRLDASMRKLEASGE